MLNRCVMHRYTGPAPGILVSGGIGYDSQTSLVRIAVKNSALQAMTKTRALSALISSERVLSTNVLFKSGESRSQSPYAGIGLSCPGRKFTPTDTCRSEDS
ncbi:hypothetical protein TNCV_3382941 [Trichonephila clavipes]|nr:hypothetical protein TNCV_3382941 [Trichonephila clavipes]